MFINLHTHSDHSNYRLRDSINTVKSLIDYTHELGHKGVALTEHETVGSTIEALKYYSSVKQTNPEEWKDYKLIFGNEIYLCNRKAIEENKDYTFYHFVLLAKDQIGHKQIRELSTKSWINNSFTYVMQRVPTYYDEIIEVIGKNQGHIVGSTACLGGALQRQIVQIYENNPENPDYSVCIKWIEMMKKIFGEGNFFLELQPCEEDNAQQLLVNKVSIELSELTNTDYIITTDAHYLTKEDREIHKAFLNSQEGDREVDDFYATTYIMSEEEIHSYMDKQIGEEAVQKGLDNTMKIYEMCENYDIRKPLDIPYIPDNIEEPNPMLYLKYKNKVPSFEYFYNSEADCDRHLIRDLLQAIELKPEEFDNEDTYNAIEECLNSIKISSEKMNTHWSAYLLQTAILVDLCWKSGTLVGPSRGSGGGFLLLYMLRITQINPLRESTKTYHWRFLNPERVSPLDVDIDIIGSDKDMVLENLKEKYGVLHVSKVQTLLTEKAKSALLTAVRGLGIDNDIGTYLASFIKSERGLQYTLKQTYYGDEANDIPPDKEFKRIMDTEYPEVWKVAQRIEGIINGVGSHAGGVILTKEDFYDSTALMKTNTGDVITQFNLHDAEEVGLIKWDLLAIDALGRMKVCLELLIKDNVIEDKGSLQANYDYYLGVYNIEREEPKMWQMTWNREILSLFQMEKQSGVQAISLVQPKSVDDLAVINSVMRLMAAEGAEEQPLEKFARFKNDISLWYKEMEDYGLTKEEQHILEKHVKDSYGICESQEKFMQLVQEPAIGGFNLLWADKLRKSIAKKSPKDFEQLEVEFFENQRAKGLSETLCRYTWYVLIYMNKGYGFNSAHTLAYSLVGLQEMNLAYKYPIIYWNTANLIVDSGGLDGGGTNYGKIAKAIGEMRKAGVQVSLANINLSDYSFKPDVNNQRIIFGLNAIHGLGDSLVKVIMDNRPYNSLKDFTEKINKYKSLGKDNKFGNVAIIALIKAGAFDEIENRDRREIMWDFIKSISNPLKSLTMDNIEDLNELGLLSEEQKNYYYRHYKFKKYVFTPRFYANKQTGKGENTKYYVMEQKFAEPYFLEHYAVNMTEGKDYEYNEKGLIIVKRGSFDREFNKIMKEFKIKMLDSQENLNLVNQERARKLWEEMAQGTISKWEMDSLSFYYHEHELANINMKKYEIQSFEDLPTSPVVAEYRTFRGKDMPRFALTRICGTVLDKDKNKHIVTLLTPNGVVQVKFYKGQFNFYDKQISEVDSETGKKTVLEKSWFSRGNKLLVTGYRREDQFIPKKYRDSIYQHSLQLIVDIKDTELKLQTDRIGEEDETIGIW